jgi:hypothetical protein
MAPKRSQNTTCKEFIQTHVAVLAGIDFFTVEILSWRGLGDLLIRSAPRAVRSKAENQRHLAGDGLSIQPRRFELPELS